ncbi:hypothetical protein K2Z84_12585, partial [Candidatus Binatia bacterium]|nr:hypothetical protein [Candidatus Binatia bacterium]
MTTGLAGAISPWTNAWTTWSTAPVFALAFAAGLACVVVHGVAFGRRLPHDADARRSLTVGVLLFAAALALRLLWPERVHYTFNDEYEYLDHAQRLLHDGRWLLWTGPPADVALFSVAGALFGPSSEVAFVSTIVLASLTPPLLERLLRRLGADRTVALVAALLLVVVPLHVKHAASASLEIASLLLLLLVLDTFVTLLRGPGALAATSFAISLFLALTVRVENWALVMILPVVAWLLRAEVRRPRAGQVAAVVLAVVLAALYVPGILDAPIRYLPWWKSRLPWPALLANNLGFWIGPDPLVRKVPLLLGLIGMVAGLRRNRVATIALVWLACVLSVLFVLYGLNIGWTEEPHQPPPWGARGAGHDMFRFDVLLLPAVVLLLANGLVALGRAARALLSGVGEGTVARWPRRTRHGMAALGAVALAALLAWRSEWRSYHPLAFVASPYNRSFEIAELRFLRDALAALPRDARLYVLPPAEGVFVDGIAARPLAALPGDAARAD